jgi:hypothetical protein
VGSALRAFACELSGVLGRTLVYFAALGALAAGAAHLIDPAIILASMQDAVPQPEWMPIDRLTPAFALSLPGTDQAAPRYAVFRHRTGGGRKDVFTAGTLGERYLRIEIYRPGAEISTFKRDAAEIGMRADGLHRIGDLKPERDLETKFGAFALMTFKTRPEREIDNCAGLVRSDDASRLQIAAVFCNRGVVLVERSALACAIDGLTLSASGGDAKTAVLFARAEINRDFCGEQAPLLAKTHKRPPAEPPLKLRGRLAGR